MLTKFILPAVAALVLFVNSTFATEFTVPKQNIVGAESPIPLGELVDLSISPIKDPPMHFTAFSVAWKVFDGDKEKRVREYQDGIFFGAGVVPKRMTALVAITYLFTVKDGDRINEVGTKTVILSTPVIIGDGASPEPSPSDVEPKFPESKFNLSLTTYKAVMSKVPSSARKPGANNIAKSFESIASAIAAGALNEVDDILRKTTESNREAIGNKKSDWEPFFKYMQDTLYSLYENKKLVTAVDFAEAWREVAAGLKAIK